MSLFDNSLLDLYKSDTRIQQMLNGCELMNLENFMIWYLPGENIQRRRSTRLQQNTDYKTADLTLTEKEEKDLYIRSMTLLKDLATAVCGKNAIGKKYGRSSILNAVSNPEYDFLVAVDMDLPQTTPAKRISSVVAFLAAEKGECLKSEPDIDRSSVYSVNLICCKQNNLNTVKTVKSVVLLGAYMYCIKNNSSVAKKDKIGILELAGAYVNLSGFFAYTKVGFDKDKSLFGQNCFPDAGNLAMSVDIKQYTNEDIFGMVTGTKRRDVSGIKDDTGIYKLGLPDNNNSPEAHKQSLVARISSLKHMMEFDYAQVQNTPHLKSFKDSILDNVKKSSSKQKLSAREETQAVQDYFEIENAEYKKLMNKKYYKAPVVEECNGYSCGISGGRTRIKTRSSRSKSRSAKSRSSKRRL